MRPSIALAALCVCVGCVPIETPPTVDPATDMAEGPDGGPVPDAEPSPDAAPERMPDRAIECAEIVPAPAEPIDPMAELDGPYHRCQLIGLGAVVDHAWLPGGAVIAVGPTGVVARVEAERAIAWQRVVFDGPVRAVDVSVDGRFIVVAAAHAIALLDAEDGAIIRRVDAPDGLINAIAFGPDRCTIATGALVDDRGDGSLAVGPVAADAPDWRSGGHLSTIALGYSPDGSMLAAVRKGNGYTLGEPIDVEVQVLAVADGALLHRLPGEVFGWTPDGAALWVGREDGTLTRLDVLTGDTSTRAVFEPAEMRLDAPRNMRDLIALPDGRLVVGHAATDAVHILDGETLDIDASLDVARLGPLALGPDGVTLMLTIDGELRSVPIDRLDGPQRSWGTAWAPRLSMADDGTVGALTTLGVATVLPPGETEPSFELPIGYAGPPESVVLSADGTRLVFSARGSGLHVVDLASGVPEGLLLDSPQSTRAVAISPDGRLAAAGVGPSSVALWTIDGGRPTYLPEEPINQDTAIFGWIRAIAFSPDGRWLAAAGAGFQASRIWSLDDLSEETFGGQASALAFDPDSTALLASPSSRDQRALPRFSVPELERGDIEIDAQPVALAWTRVGIWTAASRATALRDPATGEIRASLPGAESIAATPDGETVAIVNRHRGLELWCASH